MCQAPVCRIRRRCAGECVTAPSHSGGTNPQTPSPRRPRQDRYRARDCWRPMSTAFPSPAEAVLDSNIWELLGASTFGFIPEELGFRTASPSRSLGTPDTKAGQTKSYKNNKIVVVEKGPFVINSESWRTISSSAPDRSAKTERSQ